MEVHAVTDATPAASERALTRLRQFDHPLQVGEHVFGPGRHHARIPVTTGLDGGEVAVHVHAVVGSRPGPTLTLTSTLHGVEWLSIEMIRRLLDRLEVTSMRGAVLGLPVVNPPALGAFSRTSPDDADSPDLNRIFPGKHTWTNDLIAKVVTRHVLPATSALVDFHLGIWGSAFGYVAYGGDFSDAEVARASKEMAGAFGFDMVCKERFIGAFPGPAALAAYAAEAMGIPSCIGELGGAGFSREREEAWIEDTVKGLENVLRSMGVIEGEATPPRRHLHFENKVRLNPSVGGMLHPVREEEQLGREVTDGELLARVISPYTFEVIEELRAPFDGYLAWIARWYPVRPGDWAFGVIPKHDPTTVWVDATS
jgi:uncharacterized protein